MRRGNGKIEGRNPGSGDLSTLRPDLSGLRSGRRQGKGSMEKLRTQIKVVAIFQDGHAQPHLFNWNSRTYKVTELHTYYQTKEGRALAHHWAVTAQLADRQSSGNTYFLNWNSETLEWYLVGIDDAESSNVKNQSSNQTRSSNVEF